MFKDKNEYEFFFKENYASFCRYAFSFIKDADQAEEIVQEILIKLWQNQKNISIQYSVKNYVYTSIKNACFNYIKHLQVRKEHQDKTLMLNPKHANLNKEIEANELNEKINLSIDKMPEQRKKIFKMSRFEGLKYKEISEKLNISVKTVENHMGLAMKFLRNELKDYITIILFFLFLH